MEPLVRMCNIGKSFSGVRALNNVSVDFYPGRAHILLGENGAGKSTLIKILSGVYQKDDGSIFLNGAEIAPQNPREGLDLGISVIHQELSVVPDLTVSENVFLDSLPKKAGTFVDFKALHRKTQELMVRLNISNIRPTDKLRNLTVADRQMVEIMRATSRNARVVIMDEPTSSLSEREITSLFSVIESLKRQNVAVIYISHKLKELMAVGDDISIFKDGELVCTRLVSELTEPEMVSLMVGREIGSYYVRAPKAASEAETVLEVKNLCGDKFSDISFSLKKGEVLGFAGLIGAGRTEVMRSVFGADRYRSGEIYVKGSLKRFKHPSGAIAEGIGLVPEDRRGQGVLLDVAVKKNISIVSLKSNSKINFIDFKWETDVADKFIEKLRVKTPGAETVIRNLSGGNQQKVVLAKWLAAESDILILDEPTRGIDVNAKSEIYRLISEYTKEGGSVILVSSELPEILGITHRICVMRNGRITAFIDDSESATEEEIMHYATIQENV